MICFLLVLAPAVRGDQIQDPMQLIHSSNDKILSIYQKSKHMDQQVQKKIFSVMEGVTDFATIGKRATEGFCSGNSKALCSEFQKTFIELLKLNGLRKLGNYRADRFDYKGKEIKGNVAIIKTIAYYKDDSIQLSYVLERRGDSWRIVDYIADGVDTIRNYRQQFRRILEKSSLSELVARLKDKVGEYRQESLQ
jgi:phospholipid transport system substrate-binding protein